MGGHGGQGWEGPLWKLMGMKREKEEEHRRFGLHTTGDEDPRVRGGAISARRPLVALPPLPVGVTLTLSWGAFRGTEGHHATKKASHSLHMGSRNSKPALPAPHSPRSDSRPLL